MSPVLKCDEYLPAGRQGNIARASGRPEVSETNGRRRFLSPAPDLTNSNLTQVIVGRWPSGQWQQGLMRYA